MTAGRPTLYTPEIVELANAYLEGGYLKVGDAIPSVIGMAKVLKVGKSTLYDWSDDEENAFSDILPKCKEYQEHALLNGGLKGELNSNITKLALGKHGYHDKQDLDAKVDAKVDANWIVDASGSDTA